jgi:hypothetical protein
MTLNGKATRLRDRYPRANAHIRWNPSISEWATIDAPLDDAAFERHAAGRAVLGTYPAVDGVAREGVIDVDLHLERDPTPDEVATVEGYALKKHRELTARGVDAVLLRHHPYGSFHIVFFVCPMAADRLGRWLKQFVADVGTIHVDTFPSPVGEGNAVRLPGRHHKRPDSWTEVRVGEVWEPWPACVEAMIGLRDNEASAFPDPGCPKASSWTPPPQPTEPTAENRRKAVEALAGQWPKVGGRRVAGLALAGGLLRAGYPVAWVEEFVRDVASAAQDDEIEKRVRGVADTRRSLENGDNATGWPSLSKTLRKDGPALVASVNGWLNIPVTPRATFGGAGASGKAVSRSFYTPLPEWRPFPTKCLPAPWNKFVRQGAAALRCDEALVALPVLTALAGAIGNTRRVHIGAEWYEPAVIWSCVVAESGGSPPPPTWSWIS